MNQDEKKEYRVTKLTKKKKRNRNVINNILLQIFVRDSLVHKK